MRHVKCFSALGAAFRAALATTVAVAPIAAFLLLTGCANKSQVRYDKLSKAAAAQDFKRAIAQVRKDPGLYGSQSKLLYHLDLGILFHYAGQYDSSLIELAKAIQLHDDLFTKSISNEALSLVTNDNMRPYRGKPHEIVLLHLFQAFNYLAKNQIDAALVEARQTQLYLQELQRKAGNDTKAYTDDGLFRAIAALCYEAAGQRDDALISLYHSIKAYQANKMTAPPSLARYTARALAENDRKNDLDVLRLPASEAPKALEPVFYSDDAEVILVGHGGKAPMLEQHAFWGTWVRDGVLVVNWNGPNGVVSEALPAPGIPDREYQKAAKGKRTRSGTTFHIKFAMPALKQPKSSAGRFSLNVDGQGSAVSETYGDLDDLLRQYLDESRMTILTRTVIRVVLRTMAAETTKSNLRTDNPLLNLALNVGTDVLADQLEQADTRTWFLLPQRVEIARMALKPGEYRISAAALDKGSRALQNKDYGQVTLRPREKKFIFLSAWQ